MTCELCPRPINGADCDSAAWCVLAGNCGCDHGFKLLLRPARGMGDAFSDSVQQRRDAWMRVDELEAEASRLRTALQAMVSAQHAGPITDEMYKAWEAARLLLTPNANSPAKPAD